MRAETAFLISSVVTLATSAIVVILLRKPLLHILIELCGNDNRARFWTVCASVVFFLVPAIAVMTAGQTDRPLANLFAVVDQTRWALVGLLTALVGISFLLLVFLPPVARVLPIDHADDVQRLLDKVEEIRARQILKRAGTPERTTA